MGRYFFEKTIAIKKRKMYNIDIKYIFINHIFYKSKFFD